MARSVDLTLLALSRRYSPRAGARKPPPFVGRPHLSRYGHNPFTFALLSATDRQAGMYLLIDGRFVPLLTCPICGALVLPESGERSYGATLHAEWHARREERPGLTGSGGDRRPGEPTPGGQADVGGKGS